MTFFISGMEYNPTSIDLVKKFIIDCKIALGKNPFLWFAFQSNSLSDYCYSSELFKEEFENMIKFFEEEVNFSLPKLFMNMRNSREVTEVAKTVKTDSLYLPSKITNIVDYLNVWKSSISSYIPTLVPISSDDLAKNYSILFEHATEKGKLNVILFRGDSKFDLKKIEMAILACGVEQDNIFIHTFKSKHTKEDIKSFLLNKKGFLIVQEELFCGMEAKSVVYCLEDSYDGYDHNIRVNVMRACSQLNIIYRYRKDYHNRIEFPKANLDPTFMNGCEKVMKCVSFKCITCQNITKELGRDGNETKGIGICKSCSLSCHHYHKKEHKDRRNPEIITSRSLERNNMEKLENWKGDKCECPTKHPICLYKNVK